MEEEQKRKASEVLIEAQLKDIQVARTAEKEEKDAEAAQNLANLGKWESQTEKRLSAVEVAGAHSKAQAASQQAENQAQAAKVLQDEKAWWEKEQEAEAKKFDDWRTEEAQRLASVEAAETQAEIEQTRISREVFSTRREDQSHLKEESERWAKFDDRLDRMQEKAAKSMAEEATVRAAIGNAVQDLESWHEQQDKKWVQADAAKKQEQEQQSHREASDMKARQDIEKEMKRKWLELDEWEKQQDAMWAEEQETRKKLEERETKEESAQSKFEEDLAKKQAEADRQRKADEAKVRDEQDGKWRAAEEKAAAQMQKESVAWQEIEAWKKHEDELLKAQDAKWDREIAVKYQAAERDAKIALDETAKAKAEEARMAAEEADKWKDLENFKGKDASQWQEQEVLKKDVDLAKTKADEADKKAEMWKEETQQELIKEKEWKSKAQASIAAAAVAASGTLEMLDIYIFNFQSHVILQDHCYLSTGNRYIADLP
jgi:hypothetical protein